MDRSEQRAVLGGLLVAALLLGLRAAPDSLLRSWERVVLDPALAYAMPAPPSAVDITVILVDDESLARLRERWPLSRLTWARFLRRLAQHRPAAVGLDVWFEGPAPSAEVELARDLVDELEDSGLDRSPAGRALSERLERLATTRDGDRQLTAALAELGNVVMGFACLGRARDALSGAEAQDLRSLPVPVHTLREPGRCPRPARSFSGITLAARGEAALAVPIDPDGAVRRYAYVCGGGDRALPSLALALAQIGRPEQADALLATALNADRGEPMLPPRPRVGLRTLRLSDVLEVEGSGAALQGALRDRLVVVGVSAQGTQDYSTTALETGLPGVYVHATALAALLDGRLLRSEGRPAWWGAGAGLLLLCLLAVVVRGRRPATVLLVAAGGACALWAGVVVVGLRQGWVLPSLPVWVGAALWLAVRLTSEFRRGVDAWRRARTIRRAFGHYLAPTVVDALIADPGRLRLGGERTEITAFFSDIKGFTELSEQLDPAALVELLNECLGSMTAVILEEGGTVDKYIGDATVAMFGAPLSQPDHATRACRAALRCQQAMDDLGERWVARGLPALKVRIGLNTGVALVGNLGSERRFDFTMLGDMVNLAARLEGVNKAYGTDTLVSEAVVDRCGPEVLFREVDTVQVVGKQTATRVFEPLGLESEVDPELRARMARYADALAAWRQRRFTLARPLFETLAERGDPAAATFVARLAALGGEEPPEGWEGVHRLRTK